MNMIKINIKKIYLVQLIFIQNQKIQLTGDEWSTENGILTPTLKIRRAVIEKQYSESIEAMYR